MSSFFLCPDNDKDGWGPVSRDRDFDFTLCFEERGLFPVLFGSLLLLVLARTLVLLRNSALPRTAYSLKVLKTKLCLLFLAAICSLASLVLGLQPSTRIYWPLLTVILNVLAFTIIPIFTYLNHMRTRTSSSILLLFWPAYTLIYLIWIRSIATTTILTRLDLVLWLNCAAITLGLLSFVLEILGTEFEAETDEHREIDKLENDNPLVRANIFSKWSFGWMTPLMKLGYSKYLTEDDMYTLLPNDESANLGSRLQAAMKKHTSLWAALFNAYGGPFAFAAFLKILQDCLAFAQPQLLRILLTYITNYQRSREEGSTGTRPSPLEGFAITLLMFFASMAQTAILHQYFQRVFETGMRVRAGLVTAIYRKALILSGDERGARATGDIVNLMSVDAMKLQNLCTYGLIVISGPFQIALAFVSLYNILGWPAFVGVAIMTISVPAQTIIAKYLKKLQEQQMKNRDQRTRLMSELLMNIKSIKLYGWEPAFIQRILRVRNDQELKMLRKIGLLSAYNNSLWTSIPLLVAFSSFVVAALMSSKPLTSSTIFPAISLFMLLQFPLAMFATITSSVIEAIVSINRLSSFLGAEELQLDARKVIDKTERLEGDEVLNIRDGEFQWSSHQMESTLHGIDLTVRKGELVGVLGRVGAGKTSLLAAIIGEMRRTEGSLTLSGSVAYCPQTPWIMSATVRENILFSHTYEPEFYERVLDACALRQDLTLFAEGDLTQVGEKGITLSGGQRARISLARAVYARADLYLLDDVLAAVDSHVARHVFDHVIGPSGILATKARILVTNAVSFLRQHDQLIFIRRGIILESGTYQQILSDQKKELYKLLMGHSRILASQSGSSTPRGDDETLSPTPPSEHEITDGTLTVEGSVEKLERKRSYGKAALLEVGKSLRATTQPDGAPKEHSERGRVKWSVYMTYIRATSLPGFIMFLVNVVLTQASQVLANITLKQWGEHNRQEGSNAGMSTYLIVYGLCSTSTILTSLLGTILLFVFCTLRSARVLHNAMLFAVMRAPLSFFEQTPTGRTMNLFSRDIYIVDQVLNQVLSSASRNLASIGGILAVIGFSFPAFLIAVPVLAYFYYRIMAYYLATGRELKRLDATTRSPIFTSFSETLNGISTIRAFGQQNIFIIENERRIDRNQMCYLLSISVNRWLAVRLEILGSSLILIAALLACSALVTGGVNAGLVGLVLSYGLNTTNSLSWFVRSASEVEQNIVSVERILHQTGVTPEAPEHIPEAIPDRPWPSEGKVEFKSYSMRYRPDLDLVLRNISLTINPREKIGICGRTGAGKSSLLLALFRILEPDYGTICIDGVDITTLGLYDLRSAISIIPQESQMFEGTMRENVDPTGQHEDSDIWAALEQAHLKGFVQSMPGGLDAKVQEGGTSISSGQRQLLCFARALLRKSRILVLDEATSAIDLETDKAVQDILRGPQFANTTILTIAHRLNTIIESDRVLVLSDGKVAEFDSPKALLEKPDSMFASLAREAGLNHALMYDS